MLINAIKKKRDRKSINKTAYSSLKLLNSFLIVNDY